MRTHKTMNIDCKWAAGYRKHINQRALRVGEGHTSTREGKLPFILLANVHTVLRPLTTACCCLLMTHPCLQCMRAGTSICACCRMLVKQ